MLLAIVCVYVTSGQVNLTIPFRPANDFLLTLRHIARVRADHSHATFRRSSASANRALPPRDAIAAHIWACQFLRIIFKYER